MALIPVNRDCAYSTSWLHAYKHPTALTSSPLTSPPYDVRTGFWTSASSWTASTSRRRAWPPPSRAPQQLVGAALVCRSSRLGSSWDRGGLQVVVARIAAALEAAGPCSCVSAWLQRCSRGLGQQRAGACRADQRSASHIKPNLQQPKKVWRNKRNKQQTFKASSTICPMGVQQLPQHLPPARASIAIWEQTPAPPP